MSFEKKFPSLNELGILFNEEPEEFYEYGIEDSVNMERRWFYQDSIENNCLDKAKVKEVFESLLISFQEEATSKHSSEDEIYSFRLAYKDVENKMKELGLNDIL